MQWEVLDMQIISMAAVEASLVLEQPAQGRQASQHTFALEEKKLFPWRHAAGERAERQKKGAGVLNRSKQEMLNGSCSGPRARETHRKGGVNHRKAPVAKTDKRLQQAIQPFDQRPSEVKALLNTQVICLKFWQPCFFSST